MTALAMPTTYRVSCARCHKRFVVKAGEGTPSSNKARGPLCQDCFAIEASGKSWCIFGISWHGPCGNVIPEEKDYCDEHPPCPCGKPSTGECGHASMNTVCGRPVCADHDDHRHFGVKPRNIKEAK